MTRTHPTRENRLARVQSILNERPALACLESLLESPGLETPGPWVAVTSSRLGLDPQRHQQVCRFLTRTMADCLARGGTLLVAEGSAIDPWATRAAQLYRVPLTRLVVDGTNSPESGKLCRDSVVIALADRVDALHVRCGGKVFAALQRRLAFCNDASTRVAITGGDDGAALKLLEMGAVGWYYGAIGRLARANTAWSSPTFPSTIVSPVDPATDSQPLAWTNSDGQWLVHCTRGQSGAWPGETQRQYRDAMLLGDNDAAWRTPLAALTKIIRSRRLVGSAIASDHRYRVVCFSASSLRERLQSRCYRAHLKRWDGEPYGIAIRVEAARRLGVKPVIYGKPSDRARVSESDRYLFQSVGTRYDWTSEREWRLLGDLDLTACDRDDIRVFVPLSSEAESFAALCPWEITCVASLLTPNAIIPD